MKRWYNQLFFVWNLGSLVFPIKLACDWSKSTITIYHIRIFSTRSLDATEYLIFFDKMPSTSTLPPTIVDFQHKIAASFAAKLTIALIKHILFTKGQLPWFASILLLYKI